MQVSICPANPHKGQLSCSYAPDQTLALIALPWEKLPTALQDDWHSAELEHKLTAIPTLLCRHETCAWTSVHTPIQSALSPWTQCLPKPNAPLNPMKQKKRCNEAKEISKRHEATNLKMTRQCSQIPKRVLTTADSKASSIHWESHHQMLWLVPTG